MDVPKLLDGRLKVRHLVLVDALTQHGSVTAAAAHLHVTQPVISRSLHELERILGVPLYDRGPRGLTPTTYGAVFTAHARTLLAQLTVAGEHIAEMANAARGTVVVGNHFGGTTLLLPRAISRLKQNQPRVAVIIREAPLQTLLAEIESGRIDLLTGRLSAFTIGPSLHRELLYTEPLQVVARATHPAFRTPAINLGSLCAYPWILPGSETGLRAELETAFANRQLTLPENRVEGTAILTVKEILADTDSITVLPFLMVRGDPSLRVFPIPLAETLQTVSLVTAADRPPSPHAELLLGHIRAVAREIQDVVDRYTAGGRSELEDSAAGRA